jgi:starvation-inducible outer membrane lipoprotein
MPATSHRTAPPISSRPWALSFCALILAGCAERPQMLDPRPVGVSVETIAAPTSDDAPRHDSVAEMAALKAISVAPLTPDRALDAGQAGKRIRWAGGVQQIATTERGVCLTVLYATAGDAGEPRWSQEASPQTFRACANGTYDPKWVAEFTNITIIGRITGKTSIGMGGGTETIPGIEIEKLFRWSDCLSGDTSPVCRIGFVTPMAVPRE